MRFIYDTCDYGDENETGDAGKAQRQVFAWIKGERGENVPLRDGGGTDEEAVA